MTEYNYELLRKLFGNLHELDDFILELDSLESVAETLDDPEMVAALDLSIVSQLRNIKEGGENVVLDEYFEVKDGDRIVGAKGIVNISMDWSDIDTPFYYYEFGHLETGGEPEEYVREFHMDQAVLQVFGPLETRASQEEPGSDEGRNLIARVVEISTDMDPELKAQVKYRCLISAENFEVWKVGFHQGVYQLFATAPGFIGSPNIDTLLKYYLKGKKQEEQPGLTEPMDREQLSKVQLRGQGGDWYNVGVFDLDPELTERNRLQAEQEGRTQLAEEVYQQTLDNRFLEVDPQAFGKVVSLYTPKQLAVMAVMAMDPKAGIEAFERTPFIQACQQHCPDALKEAYGLLTRLSERLPGQ